MELEIVPKNSRDAEESLSPAPPEISQTSYEPFHELGKMVHLSLVDVPLAFSSQHINELVAHHRLFESQIYDPCDDASTVC